MVPVYCSSGKIAEATVGRSSSTVALMSSALNAIPAFDLLKNVPLHFIAAQGHRLRLRQADDAQRQRRPCLLAQSVERQTPLDGGLA